MAANQALSATRRLANRVSLCSELSAARRSLRRSVLQSVFAAYLALSATRRLANRISHPPEPVLSYGDIPDNPDPPTAEQQMECGKRSTANSGSGHDDSAHSIPGSSVRIHSDSDVENNRGEATTVEPGSPGSFLGQQQ